MRAAVAVAGILALTAGTAYGEDDWFPLAPFRMFSTADDPDRPVDIARVDAVDATGAHFPLDEDASGVRRAEIEGRMAALKADPGLVAALAEAYAERHPGAADLVRIDVVVEHHELSGGEVTGVVVDEVVATWHR